VQSVYTRGKRTDHFAEFLSVLQGWVVGTA